MKDAGCRRPHSLRLVNGTVVVKDSETVDNVFRASRFAVRFRTKRSQLRDVFTRDSHRVLLNVERNSPTLDGEFQETRSEHLDGRQGPPATARRRNWNQLPAAARRLRWGVNGAICCAIRLNDAA